MYPQKSIESVQMTTRILEIEPILKKLPDLKGKTFPVLSKTT